MLNVFGQKSSCDLFFQAYVEGRILNVDVDRIRISFRDPGYAGLHYNAAIYVPSFRGNSPVCSTRHVFCFNFVINSIYFPKNLQDSVPSEMLSVGDVVLFAASWKRFEDDGVIRWRANHVTLKKKVSGKEDFFLRES